MPSKPSVDTIRDIIENGDAILDYTAGIDFADYRDNHIVRDATERCFARISEAAVKLGPWRSKNSLTTTGSAFDIWATSFSMTTGRYRRHHLGERDQAFAAAA